MVWPAIAAIGGSVLSAIGQRSAQRSAERQAAAANQASAAQFSRAQGEIERTNLVSEELARGSMRENTRQFGQIMDHSMARRVADARRAGLHPLAALGTSMGGPSPSGLFGPSSGGSAPIPGQAISGSHFGGGLEALGSGLTRVGEMMDARATRAERVRAQNKADWFRLAQHTMGLEQARSGVSRNEAETQYYLAQAALARSRITHNNEDASIPASENPGKATPPSVSLKDVQPRGGYKDNQPTKEGKYLTASGAPRNEVKNINIGGFRYPAGDGDSAEILEGAGGEALGILNIFPHAKWIVEELGRLTRDNVRIQRNRTRRRNQHYRSRQPGHGEFGE
jgi:hypothetical protein